MTPGSRDYSDTIEIERLRAINAELQESVDQAAAAISRLYDRNAELLAALEEAELQIAYLHERWMPTGSGNAVLSRVSAVIARAKGE